MTIHQTALPLYDPPPEAPPAADPAPAAHARRADPETSHAAAASLTPGTLRASQAEVLTILRQGPMHDQRIAQTALAWHSKQSPSGLRTRRAELVAAGLVEDSGRREILPSGRSSVVWRLTAKGRDHDR
jgi:hypothetical protein